MPIRQLNHDSRHRRGINQYSLRAEELCHALGVEIGSADLDLENLPALWTLVASCLGLVMIVVFSSAVRLVYFTLRASLVSPTRNEDEGLAEIQFIGSHPDADVSNPHGPPTPSSADCNEGEVVQY